MKGKKTGAGDVLLLVLSALLLLGVLFVFGPCGAKEDGGWMTCHWAGQAVAGVAALLTALALAHLFAGDPKIKLGLDIAAIPTALLALLIPGRLIGLCMMAEMRCRSIMAPAVTVLSILIALAAAADIFARRKKG